MYLIHYTRLDGEKFKVWLDSERLDKMLKRSFYDQLRHCRRNSNGFFTITED